MGSVWCFWQWHSYLKQFVLGGIFTNKEAASKAMNAWIRDAELTSKDIQPFIDNRFLQEEYTDLPSSAGR